MFKGVTWGRKAREGKSNGAGRREGRLALALGGEMNIDDSEVRERVMPIIAKAREDKGRAEGEARRGAARRGKIKAQAGKGCVFVLLISDICPR